MMPSTSSSRHGSFGVQQSPAAVAVWKYTFARSKVSAAQDLGAPSASVIVAPTEANAAASRGYWPGCPSHKRSRSPVSAEALDGPERVIMTVLRELEPHMWSDRR